MSGEQEQGFIDEILRQKKGRNKGKFNPTHSDVDKAVDDFLKSGGTIKREKVNWDMDLETVLNIPNDGMEAMDFLAGVL